MRYVEFIVVTTIFCSRSIVLLGSCVSRPLPAVHARGPSRSPSAIYARGISAGEGVVRLLWHEYIHNQPCEFVFQLSSFAVRLIIGMVYL